MTSSMLDATVYADLYHGFLTQVFFTYLIINWTLLHEQCVTEPGPFLAGSGSRLLKSLQSKNINLTVDFKKFISKAFRAVKK